jgi:hypothetical protein
MIKLMSFLAVIRKKVSSLFCSCNSIQKELDLRKRPLRKKEGGSVLLALVIALVIMVIFIVTAQVYVQASASLLGFRNEIPKVGATPSLQQPTQE